MAKDTQELKYKALMEENKLLRAALEGLLHGEDGAVLRFGSKSPKVKAAHKALSLGALTSEWHKQGK